MTEPTTLNGLTKRKSLGPPLPLGSLSPNDPTAEPITPRDRKKQEIADRWQGAYKKIKRINSTPPPMTFASKVGQYVYLNTETPGFTNHLHIHI